jgi:hypothetical protein
MGARLVAVVMAKFADRRTCETYVGAETIAQCAGMNERTVRRHREQLEAAGWISSQASRRRGRGRLWRLVIPPGIPDKSPGNPAGIPDSFDAITGQKRPHYRTNRPPIPFPDPLLGIPKSADALAPEARAPLEPGPGLPAELARRLQRRRGGGAA